MKGPALNDANARRFHARIKQDGHTFIAVVPDPPGQILGWTYTVGLTLARLPELVVPDVSPATAMPCLEHAITFMRTHKIIPRMQDQILMADGSLWDVAEQQPKDSDYGLPWAMRLYGERHPVRALRLTAPPHMAPRPGSRWSPGYNTCQCGNTAHHQKTVGSIYLG